MANFISPTGDYPRHIGDIQIENPDYEYGDSLPAGWREVALVQPPIYDSAKEALQELSPVEVAGVMTQQWVIRPYTEDELAIINAPKTAKAKLIALGLTEAEIRFIARGL